jgi:hypothetical protein
VNTSPIFIMSSERSGSNLLRTLLSNHTNISAPMAPQLLKTFLPIISQYNSLSAKENARKLFEDMLAVVNHPIHGWNLNIKFIDIYERYHPKVFLDFFDLLYRENAAKDGKNRFLCKENNTFDFVRELVNYYEDPKIIYLYRDPRDYAVSRIKAPLGPNTSYRAALLWTLEQRTCDQSLKNVNIKTHNLKYEDLIEHVQNTVSAALQFIGEPVQARCFSVDVQKNKKLSWNVMWKNLSKPVLKSNRGKYREKFNAREIKIIETVAKGYLTKLGYDLESSADFKVTRLFKLTDKFIDLILRLKKKSLVSGRHRAMYTSKASLVGTIKEKDVQK